MELAERLPTPSRILLHIAAVIGLEFSIELLEEVIEGDSLERLDRARENPSEIVFHFGQAGTRAQISYAQYKSRGVLNVTSMG